MTADWYSRSLARMERFALVIAAAGTLAFLINTGWRSALGFACGAVISRFNFGLWKRITAAVGEQGPEATGDGKAVMLSIRYLLIGGAVFVIIRILDVSPLAVLGGLLVTVAAVLVEMMCQLIRPNDSSR